MGQVDTVAQLAALQTQVLWAAFAVSMAFGWLVQKSHFCTMGALSDIVNMGDWSRMRMWVMAMGVATLGFQGMAWLGWIDPAKTFYTASRVLWLSALVGGLLFGFGMVLASGCGSKTLVRMGSGSLKALVVFFVMGFAAFATLRGITAVWRVQTVDAVGFGMADSSSVPHWLAGQLGQPGWTTALALLMGLAMLLWSLSSRTVWTGHHVLGGLGLGACVTAMWWVTGHLGFVPEHPETLDAVHLATSTGQMESLTFTAPMAYLLEFLVYYSDTSRTLTTGVASVLGVVCGSLVHSLWTRSFRWEGFRGTQDTALHVVGALLMGVGGVAALGCTVGQGLSGVSTLSLTSLLALAGIVAGALAGLRFQLWLVMRD
jgi:uncharacterized membrane protein YedE/YeeE